MYIFLAREVASIELALQNYSNIKVRVQKTVSDNMAKATVTEFSGKHANLKMLKNKSLMLNIKVISNFLLLEIHGIGWFHYINLKSICNLLIVLIERDGDLLLPLLRFPDSKCDKAIVTTNARKNHALHC